MTELIRGRYEPLEVLGSGSQGEVLLCLDHQLDRRVAIKARRIPSEKARQAALAEAAVLLKMRPHPNVSLVREDFFEDDRYFIVMDWIEGTSLAKRLTAEGTPSIEDARRWLAQIASALDHLHAHDPPILHKDVKPANIVVTADGTAVLVDFGTAQREEDRGPGSPAYTAPELARGGPPSAAADVYSLGVTAHEVITGHLPEPGVSPILTMDADPSRAHLRRALAAALAPDPASRPASAAAFVELLRGSPVPIPPALSTPDPGTLAGRDREMAFLRGEFDRVLAGESRLVLVAGEAGIGKTRLTSEFGAMAHAAGATVLFGRTDSEPLAPFQPLVEALSHYTERCPLERLRSEIPSTAAELTLLLPSLEERLTDLAPLAPADPETRRYRLFAAVSSLLVSIARNQPLVMLLDDLHWADRSTLALLAHLFPPPEAVRMLIVGTYRDSEVDAAHPLAGLIARFRPGHDIGQVTLEGLPLEAVGRLMAKDTGHAPPPRLTRDVLESTKGNPLFVHEMSRHLVASNALAPDGQWQEVDLAELGVPKGIGTLIEMRVSRLAPESRHVLDIAAISGREFDLGLVERVLGSDPLPAIEEAVRARLVGEEPAAPGRFSFSHALFRQSIYEQVTPSRRVRIHAQIADAMEETAGDLAEILGDLAHHRYMAAKAGGAEAAARAVEFSIRAGDAAADRAAFEEAVAHYWRAEELMGQAGRSEDERFEVLMKIAQTASRVVLWDETRRAVQKGAEIARAEGSAEALARCALGLFTFYIEPAGVKREDLELMDEALRALPVEDGPLRARLLVHRGWTELNFVWPPTPPEAWGHIEAETDEALAMARRLDDPLTSAYVTVFHGMTRFDPRFAPAIEPLTAEAVGLARASGSMDLLGVSLLVRATTLTHLGRLSDARREAIGPLEELGEFAPLLAWLGTSCRLGVAILQGRLAEADDLADLEGRQLQRLRSPSQGVIHLCLLHDLRRIQGRLDEVLPMLDGIARALPLSGFIRSLLACALADAGRLALTQEHYELVAADHFEAGRSLITGRLAMSYCTEACVALEDAERAPILYEMLAPYESVHMTDTQAGARGYGAHYRGMLAGVLGDFDEAERLFLLATELHQRMESPPYIAETALRHAEMLLTRGGAGDQAKAAALLAEALNRAVGIGADGLAASIRAAQTALV